jgi:two-component system, NarL family, sensor kinase
MRLRFLAFLIILFADYQFVTAQTVINFDSLVTANQNYVKEDSVKLKMLLKVSELYMDRKAVTGIEYANKAISLAQKLKKSSQLTDAYYFKAFNFIALSRYSEALETLEKALAHNLQVNDNHGIGKMYYGIAETNRRKSNVKKAQEYFNLSLSYFQKEQESSDLAMLYNSLGNLNINTTNYPKSVTFFQKAIVINERLKNLRSLSFNLNNLGLVYTYLGEYQKALENIQKAVAISEKLGNVRYVAMQMDNEGFVYYKLQNYKKATEYLEKAFNINKEIGNKSSFAINCNNLGLVNKGTKDYPKALEYFQKALQVSEEIGDKNSIAKANFNIGSVAYEIPNSEENTHKNRFENAIEILTKNIKFAEEIKAFDIVQSSWEEISKIHEKTGEFGKAFESYKKYIDLKESILGNKTSNQVTEMEAQFNFEKKETALLYEQKLIKEQLEKQQLVTIQQNQKLKLNEQNLTLAQKEKDLQRLAYLKEKAEKQEKQEKLILAEKDRLLKASELIKLGDEKALQEQTLANKNTLIALLISSFIGFLLFVFANYLWQRQKTLKREKANSLNFTKQLLENIEVERKRIASDLHDSVSHELLSLKSDFSEDLSKTGSKIDSIINEIRGISRNLHPVMFDTIGLVPNIEQLVERIQKQHDFMIRTEVNYQGSLSQNDELQIYRILQEALSNIIKYANAHAGKITIKEFLDKIYIEIKDNGKGFNVKEILRNGNAFGLYNIIERSRVIGGEAKIFSSTEGTVITINIPKNHENINSR